MRLEITQRADLAVRALVILHRSPARLKSADLAAALDTTAGFVPQVMGPLVREGWVHSVPGPTGGYEPLVGIDELNVLDVVEAVDGPTDSGRCVVADRPCAATAPCALHVAWGLARSELVSSLAALSVGALAVTA
ncbi:MAG: RrF2 family transcriptional regulator [Ilumatobacter sp.]|uniref:RrF2 family transcriptional regulator n=1 Tax=Ilumatobacter sp. TaxID=1967498 RepID=UPI00391A98BA